MKTLLALFASAFVVTFFLVSAPAGACACMPPPYLDKVSGQHGPAKAGLYSAVTDEEWAALWEMVGEEPQGYFAEGRTTAVAYFMGLRSTGGYDAYPDVYWEDTFVKVNFEELSPTGMATQALSTPYTIVVLDGVAETVFDENYAEIVSPLNQHTCDGPDEAGQQISDLRLEDVLSSLMYPATI